MHTSSVGTDQEIADLLIRVCEFKDLPALDRLVALERRLSRAAPTMAPAWMSGSNAGPSGDPSNGDLLACLDWLSFWPEAQGRGVPLKSIIRSIGAWTEMLGMRRTVAVTDLQEAAMALGHQIYTVDGVSSISVLAPAGNFRPNVARSPQEGTRRIPDWREFSRICLIEWPDVRKRLRRSSRVLNRRGLTSQRQAPGDLPRRPAEYYQFLEAWDWIVRWTGPVGNYRVTLSALARRISSWMSLPEVWEEPTLAAAHCAGLRFFSDPIQGVVVEVPGEAQVWVNTDSEPPQNLRRWVPLS